MAESFVDEFDREIVDMMEGERRGDLERFVSQTDEGIEVNWRNLIKLRAEASLESHNENLFDNILQYLQIKGVLVCGYKRGSFAIANYALMGSSPVSYNFVRERDAVNVKKVELPNAHFPTHIYQV